MKTSQLSSRAGPTVLKEVQATAWVAMNREVAKPSRVEEEAEAEEAVVVVTTLTHKNQTIRHMETKEVPAEVCGLTNRRKSMTGIMILLLKMTTTIFP